MGLDKVDWQEDLEITSIDLYTAYTMWATRNPDASMSERAFGEKLRTLVDWKKNQCRSGHDRGKRFYTLPYVDMAEASLRQMNKWTDV